MPILRASWIPGVLVAAFLTACGGSSHDTTTTTTGGGGGAGTTTATTTTTTTTSTFTPATHPALPQVVKLSGSVLAAPTVQPIAYGDDANLSDMEAFLQELTKTSYWGEATSQYGVGALTVLPTILQTGMAPATLTDVEIQADLAANTTGASPIWGEASATTIYLFLVPPQTTESYVYDGVTSTGCTDYDGYHDETTVGSTTIAYAVGCACPGFDGKGVTDLQERTVAVSHELIESATDPFSQSKPAWRQEDNADIVWTIMAGGEVADMCQYNSDSYDVPPGSTYMIQRSWSNMAAKAGTNPCVPVPTTAPYFNSVPSLPDMLTVSGFGAAPGVKIPVGQKKTIDVDLFSEGPTTGPWSVVLYDGDFVNTGTHYLNLSLDKTSGQNGDTLHLTIEVLKADTTYGVVPFILSSTLNGQNNLWMGLVGQ